MAIRFTSKEPEKPAKGGEKTTAAKPSGEADLREPAPDGVETDGDLFEAAPPAKSRRKRK